MGIFKQMKDMKEMVHAAPAMIDQAQVLQAQANQMQAAMAQQIAGPDRGSVRRAGNRGRPQPGTAGAGRRRHGRAVRGRGEGRRRLQLRPGHVAHDRRDGHGIDRDSWETAATAFNGRVTSSPAFAQHFNTLYRAG